MQLPSDWTQQLDQRGFARIPNLLSRAECDAIASYWDESERFRSEIVMARHGYGEGVYRYFASPLPDTVDRLRRSAYPELARFANVWQERLGLSSRFPPTSTAFSKPAPPPANRNPRRCCCTTRRGDTTAYTRIATAKSHSRCRW